MEAGTSPISDSFIEAALAGKGEIYTVPVVHTAEEVEPDSDSKGSREEKKVTDIIGYHGPLEHESADSSSAFSSDLKNWLLYCTRAQISKRQALWDSLHFILNCDFGIVTDTCWIRCLAEDGDVETNSGPVNFSMDDVCDCKDTSAYLSDDLSDAGSAINVILSGTVEQREEGEMPGREVDTILHQRLAVHDRDRVRTTNTHLPIF
ncbi:hypothetical protein QYM36_002663 [Artemia franciscana]|uniref:Uncharacterized protein n=1 Tax=Artemia franciscana TaxID=6661 RepID=A0AA88IHZ3_ARTSF|nr:hypothetical protein QYM36_002663 [Artemia franciscana]